MIAVETAPSRLKEALIAPAALPSLAVAGEREYDTPAAGPNQQS